MLCVSPRLALFLLEHLLHRHRFLPHLPLSGSESDLRRGALPCGCAVFRAGWLSDWPRGFLGTCSVCLFLGLAPSFCLGIGPCSPEPRRIARSENRPLANSVQKTLMKI